MKQASNRYMRLMKIVTVWVMAMFLFAPITATFNSKKQTQNSEIQINPVLAQAQTADCKVENAVFNPSSTGNSDTTNEARFYLGRDSNGNIPESQEKIIIKVRTSNCIGVPLQLKILGESDNEYAQIENNKNTGVNTIIGNYVGFTPIEQGGGLSTTAITIYPGEDNCDANGRNDDCKLFIEIYKKDNGKDVKIFDTDNPERINQRGYLGYECTGTYCSNDNLFRLVSIDYNDTDPLTELWYFKTKEKGTYYIAESATDKESCKKVATEQAKDNTDIDTESCTNNPDYKKISSSNSIINQGKPVGQAAVGACFELQLSATIFFNPANCIAMLLKDVVYPVIVWAVALVGQLFDFVFMYTISAEPYKNIFIETCWTFVRDLCNASFIFILLYIAIMTVLNQTGRANYKTILPKVILVALVINFSLFFGRAIIDVGNASARLLYKSDLVSLKNADGTQGSISGALMDSFDPQNLIQNGASNFNKVTGRDSGEVSAISIIILTLMSIFMLFILCKLFLELAFVFIGRIVGLWMQLILAPIAFLASAVPFLKIPAIAGGGGYESWLSTTFKQSIQVTVFAFFLYLTLIFAKLGIINVKIDGVSGGIAFFLSIIIPFLIIYTLLQTAKKQSISMATVIANTATEAIKSVTGTVAKVGLLAAGAAVAPMAARTVGGLASKMSNSGVLKSLSGRAGAGSNFISKRFNNLVADAATKTSGGLANLSKNKFDVRENGLVKGAFKMAGFGDTKSIDFNIPGVPKNIISDKLNSVAKSAGETPRLQGLDAMAKAKTDEMNRRLQAMKLTEDNIDKGKVKDDRKKLAEWMATQRKAMNADREAAKAAGTTFDEKDWKTKYEAANAKPKLNYEASASTKDAKIIASGLNKQIEHRFARRMERDANSPTLDERAAGLFGQKSAQSYADAKKKIKDKLNTTEDPNKKSQKKFAKDIKKARAKQIRKKDVLNSDLEKIAKQEISVQKNIDKLTSEINNLVTSLDNNSTRSKIVPSLDSYKELLDKKRADPIFATRTTSLSGYPSDHPAVKQLEKDIRKATADAYNKQFEKPLEDAIKARDEAKRKFDMVKNDKTDPDYNRYKKEYEIKQKSYATIEAETSTVKKQIEKVDKKEGSIEKEMDKRSGLQSQRRKKTKELGTT